VLKEKINNWFEGEIFIKAGLIILLFLAPLVFYPYSTSFHFTKNTVIEIIMSLIVGFWLIKQLEQKEAFPLLKSPLNLPIIIFSFTILISLFQTNSLYDSFNEIALWSCYIFLYFLITSSLKDKRWIYILLKIVILSASIAAIYCIFQFYGLDFSIWKKIGGRGSLFSTFGNPNYLAGHLAAVIPLVFVLFCLQKVKFKKIILELIIALLYTSLLMTLCRGAWIALFGSIVVMLTAIYLFKRRAFAFFKANKGWLISLILILLVISIIYSTPNPLNPLGKVSVTQRAVSVTEIGSSSMQTRFLIWLSSVETIRRSPLLGKGIGAYGLYYPSSQGAVLAQKRYQKYIPYTNKSINAHNDYLHLGAEIGLIGLSAFLWLIFTFYKNALSGLIKIQAKEKIFLIIGFMGGVTVLLIHSLFSFPFHIIPNGMLFWLILGISVVLIGGQEEIGRDENKDRESLNNLNNKEDKKYGSKKYRIFKIFKVNIFLRRFIQIGIILGVILLIVVKINWYRADMHQKKGEMLMQVEIYSAAAEQLEKSREINSCNGSNYMPLGVTYYNLGRYDEAIAAFKKAEKNWINQELYNGWGNACLKLGDLEKAEECFLKSIYMFPNVSDAYLNLAKTYILQAENDLKDKKVERAEEKLDKSFMLYNQGMIFDKEVSFPAKLIREYQKVAEEKDQLNIKKTNNREDSSDSRYFYNSEKSSILELLQPWAPPNKPFFFKAFSYEEDNINDNLKIDAWLQIEDSVGNSLISLKMNKNEKDHAPTLWSVLLKEGLPEGEYKAKLKLNIEGREIAQTEKKFNIFQEEEPPGKIIEFTIPRTKSGEIITPEIVIANHSIEDLTVWGFFNIWNNKKEAVFNVVIDITEIPPAADKEINIKWQPEEKLPAGLYKAELIIISKGDKEINAESLFLITN